MPARLFLAAFTALLTVLTASAQRMTGVKAGDVAPEIAMEDPNGDTLRLSQLRGRIVLIDFWASWCRPCRMESPHMRHTYRTYKDTAFAEADGFAVFSVSLDRPGGLEAWKKAIAQDSLEWTWHVGAVKDGRNSAAERYQVAFIPTNALIDGTGKVIATDLHGEDLDHALDGLLEKDPARLAAWRKERQAEARAAAKAAKKAARDRRHPSERSLSPARHDDR